MRKRNCQLILAGVLAMLHLSASAQGPITDPAAVNLPEILPPSPEAAAFVKAGYGGVNFSTGAVSASIPLYTLNVKGIAWPLSISYSSQGVKTDENSSRVGFGWTLGGMGVITRTVRDNPDEMANTITQPGNLGAVDSANFYYSQNVTGESTNFDSQPDEYTFSFGGNSGKFVFDSAGNILVTSHSNLKIETFTGREHFIITTTDGVKYKFGNGQYESTISHNINLGFSSVSNIKTGFYLYRIEIPGDEWIDFNYDTVSIEVVTGISQTLRLGAGGIQDGPLAACTFCKPGGNFVDYNQNTSKVEYAARYVTSITTSNGLTANFSYEPRPDMSGDKRLKTMWVATSSRIIKSYKFNYYDPPGFDGTHATPAGGPARIGRFFLVKLTDKEFPEEEIVSPDTLDHDYIFEYVDPGRTPKPFTAKQDHWGFYNGNTGNLLPPAGYYSGSTSTYTTGNRDPNPDSATKGILKSITYPTGGKEEFFYEGNTIAGSVAAPYGPVTVELAGNYQGSDTYYSYFSSSFSVPYTQQVTLNMSSIYYGEGSPPSGIIVRFYLKEDGDTLYYNWLNGNTTFQSPKTFQAGKTYQLEMKIRNDWQNAGQFSLQYDTTSSPTYYEANLPVGGVRLRKIKYSSPETGRTQCKYYKYAGLDNLSKSTGMAIDNIYYGSDGQQSFMCTESGYWGVYSLCGYLIFSSNTSYNLFRFNGSPIYYKKVIESDDSSFANGGTQYTFYDPELASTTEQIRGSAIPYIPEDNYGTLTGTLFSTLQFDKDLQMVSEQIDYYDTVTVGNSVKSVFIRKQFEPVYNPGNLENEMLAFDISRYYYKDKWYRKRATVTKTFASNNISSYDSVRYNYGTADNMLPADIRTIDSKGDSIKAVMKYPTDYTGIAALTQMVSNNMIGQTVESFLYKNDVLQKQQKIKFKNWISANDVIKPDTIQVKQSPAASLQDEIYFEKYDSSGNILQARKANDMPVAYLWDHKKTFPIAEIKNATYEQVAYTGFEGDAWGNWKPGTGSLHTGTGFTGRKSFSGTLYDTLTGGGYYIVTLWTASPPASVNSQAGTLLDTRRGWSLYSWRLTDPTNIEVSGNFMDDVRLYPEKAVISTYSYEPFVGAVARSDVNNQVAYYEYDPFNRLKMVRDIDSNIIKLYRYRYLDTIAVCTDTTAQWTATGNTRCIKNSNNNNTGIEEQEQRDMSYCSPSYLQLRWVSLGTTGNCPPAANCTGNDKRVVNGVCETGVKIYTSTVQLGPSNWECTYHYEFSDGYWTDNYIEYSSSACFNIIEDL